MIYISTFFYYICFASSALIYGIGLNRIADLDYYSDKKALYYVKIVASIFVSSVISELMVNYILVPLGITEIYPILCILIFGCINVLFESLFRLSIGISSSEFVISFIIVILSISESTGVLNTLVISGSCLISLLIVLPIVYSFRQRILSSDENKETYLCRFFIFIAIIILILSSFDITWLNKEVIR